MIIYCPQDQMSRAGQTPCLPDRPYPYLQGLVVKWNMEVCLMGEWIS